MHNIHVFNSVHSKVFVDKRHVFDTLGFLVLHVVNKQQAWARLAHAF